MARLLLVPLVAIAAILTGCTSDDGPQTTQTRQVPAFTQIDNRDSADVRLRVGERQRVEVRGGEKVIDDIHTEVRDGALEVSFDHKGFGDSDVIVHVTVPRVTSIRSDGSGDVDAFGSAGALALDLEGSGDADLSELRTREARVTVDGSGDADLHATDRLEVSIEGSGDVSYRGNPALTEQVNGSGELSRAG